MAGNYPDAPGLRMAYDRDGTTVVYADYTNPASSVLSAGSVAVLNDEDADVFVMRGSLGATANIALVFIFPELRDIAGYAIQYVASTPTSPMLAWSPDTTNGLDGTWTNVGAPVRSNVAQGGMDKLALRTAATALSVPSVHAFRYLALYGSASQNMSLTALHLYGKPSSGENPDRLRLWHSTLDQEVTGAYFDWGNTPRSSVANKLFRIKNNSSTLTANGIVVSRDAPSDTTPSVATQHTLSQDGVNFAATQNIGNLAPGALSSILTLRRTTPADAALSVWWARVLAAATTWT